MMWFKLACKLGMIVSKVTVYSRNSPDTECTKYMYTSTRAHKTQTIRFQYPKIVNHVNFVQFLIQMVSTCTLLLPRDKALHVEIQQVFLV